MILFDSYLKSPFYLENLYKYFEKKIQDLDYLWILGVGRQYVLSQLPSNKNWDSSFKLRLIYGMMTLIEVMVGLVVL